jgi:hypothetical protein
MFYQYSFRSSVNCYGQKYPCLHLFLSPRLLQDQRMKMTSLLEGPHGDPRGIQELALRWGAGCACAGRNISEANHAKLRNINFVLDSNSLWRIAGKLRGVRIECRLGRLWITQEGAPADVILQSGQSFVASNNGILVIQSVPSSTNRTESLVADGDIAFGVAIVPESVHLRISRTPKATTRTRVGFDLVERDPTANWERLAYAILWGCGLVGLAHCLKTASGLM